MHSSSFGVSWLLASNGSFENRPVDETIVAILTQHTTVKDPAAWQTARPAPVNPNGYTYPHSIQRNLDWFLANGLVDIHHHVAEQERARGRDAVVIGQSGMQSVDQPFVQREGEDVSGTPFSHVVEVQVGHLGVAAERHLDLD